MIQMNLFTKQKETHRLREQIYGCLMVHTAIFKMDNQQGPSVQYIEFCSILYNNLTVTRGEGWGERIVKEFGTDMYTCYI